MSTYTPIQDVDQKIDIIDHVNQDHTSELLAIVGGNEHEQANIASVKASDIFEEGVNMTVEYLNGKKETLFYPFTVEGELEEKVLYLAYAAIVKQGRDFSGTGKNFFEVTHTENLTSNMVRLTVKSGTPLPKYYPGYAYAFVLNISKKVPEKKPTTSDKKHWAKNLFDRAFVWLMLKLSSERRQKIMTKANKDVRLYTLRKSWKSSPEANFNDCGYIDIFTHGGTQGSQWANQLRAGDVVMSRSEAKDKHPHLAKGQALLIADETAYPALAGILEHWVNPILPYVIILSAKEDEQHYFDDALLGGAQQVNRIVCSVDRQGKEVLAIAKEIECIDVVWGALEAESAKKIRWYLRNERNVQGKDNHTKAYWSLKSKR